MELSLYWETPLEQWISASYEKRGILSQSDLDIDLIAESFGIDIVYHKGRTAADNKLGVVFLHNSHNSEDLANMRKSFFHELCHILRHVGDQRRMPDLFRQAQESEAERFSLYAAIPFFMLTKLQLPARRSEAISKISKEFRVSSEFAKQRLDQIQERISGEEFLATFTEVSATKEDVEDDNEGNLLQRISAFYDYNDYSRPHTLVIEQRDGFNWEKPLHIEVERNYKSCDLPSYMSRESASVLSGDLSVFPDRKGYVTINLSRVAWRHGTTASRLYLPMEAIDDAINF